MTPPRETVLFEAISTPPQSFTLRGFRVLAGLLILAAAIPAGIFFALGAWPVLPFIGLEVGAALAALLWHARASRRISEMVLLTDAGLSIRHVDHRGRVVRSVLDAYWAKVEWDEAAPRGGRLWIKSRGRTLESIFKPSGITWRLGKCDQTKHFQAKWNHLATRKMRLNIGSDHHLQRYRAVDDDLS